LTFRERLKDVRRYNSWQEKEALLLSLSDEVDVIEIANILGLNPINNLEAEALILKAREKSVSESIEITSSCPKCKYINLYNVEIEDMFFKDKINNNLPEGLFESISEIPDDVLNLDNLSIEEYDKLENDIIINNEKIFSTQIELTCFSCGVKYFTQIEPIKSISKFPISNLYEQYTDITYFSHMTKKDVDEMYPFEREIFLGLIQKKEDED